MSNNLKSITDLVESQVIASINTQAKLEKVITSNCNVAFLLMGDILTLPMYVSRLHENNINVFIHLDFMEGVANDKSGVQYIAKVVKPEGIITTRKHLIKHAKDENLLTIQRLFIIDNSAIDKGIQMLKSTKPDAVEILPGLIPKVITKLTKVTPLPIIAGGLIENKAEILQALEAGALGTSCGRPELWNLGI